MMAIIFVVKVFATFGLAMSSIVAALILWPHGWYLSGNAVLGGIAILSIFWGWYK